MKPFCFQDFDPKNYTVLH